MVHVFALAAASAAVLTSPATAFTLTFTNDCMNDIELYTRLASVYTDDTETIAPGASVEKTIGKGFEGHFRNGTNDAATLIEISTKGELDLTWFDISIVPPRLNPGFEFCTSLDECKKNSQSGISFNTPIEITPLSNANGQNCRSLTCLADGCEDAYNFPQDDTKTHSCASNTDFTVTFCPSGDPTQQQLQKEEEEDDQEQVQQQELTPKAADAPRKDSFEEIEDIDLNDEDVDVDDESETKGNVVTQSEVPSPEVIPVEASTVATPTRKSKNCAVRRRSL